MDEPYPIEMMPEIERFFKEEHPKHKRGPAQLYPAVFQSSLFFPLQRQTELQRMLQVAYSYKPQTVMEIGADKGGGLYHFCMLDTVKHVIACEIRGTPYAKLFEKIFPEIEFTWVGASSYDADSFNHVRRSIRLSQSKATKAGIDVLFIDGDKGAFRLDFDTYLPLMNRPGLVLMHDINDVYHYDNSPRHAFESVKKESIYRCEEYINISDYTESHKRQLQDIVSSSPHEGWLRHWRGISCGVGIIHIDK